MSVAVSRTDGVTILTLTSDQSSVCPPLCQLLGALCYSPALCSRKRLLTPHRVGAQTVLGALWIISALTHIGLGVLLINTRGVAVYLLRDTYCPVWLGVLFLCFGVCCILSEKHPRPIFVLLSLILNLGGFALSITAIVWYSADIDRPGFWELCYRRDFPVYSWGTPPPVTESPSLLERCGEAQDLLWGLTTSMRALLVALSCLSLCLALSSCILSFKTLRRGARNSSEPLCKENTKEEKEA